MQITNLQSGMWLHHEKESAGGWWWPQSRKGPVLAASPGQPRARVNWKYYVNHIYVNAAGDDPADATKCPVNGVSSPATCMFRHAIAKANQVSTASSPARILFGVSPGAMTQTAALSLTGLSGQGNITIDAIEGDGNPWIVGDPSPPQDPFACTVDLNNTTALRFDSDNNRIQGLFIANTVPPSPAQQAKDLITASSGKKNNIVYAVKIDGGNRRDCPNNMCAGSFDLFSVLGGTSFLTPGVIIENVEGLAAIDKGVKANDGWGLVLDSWFHHNYRGNIQATLGGKLMAARNFVDRAGRRVSDDLIVDDGANGLVANGGSSELFTDGNISRLNTNSGIGVRKSGSPMLAAANDYTCGNHFEGVAVSDDSATATGRGIAAVYNGDRGVKVSTTGTAWSANFGDGSGSTNPGNNAFAQNSSSNACQFANTNTSKAVNAARNYWFNDSPATCGGGTVNTSPILHFASEPLQLDDTHPTIPSNVILSGQTFRIVGSGFDAIRGNPAPSGGCTVGDGTPSTSCCLTQPAQANVCGSGTHNPLSDKGNCVELCNSAGGWQPIGVTAATPTTITATIPGSSVFLCSGDGALVHVSKRNGGSVLDGEKPYCTNKWPKDMMM